MRLNLYRRNDGRLMTKMTEADGSVEEKSVRIVRCFPWTARSHYLSLRDDSGKELYFVENLEVLDDPKVRSLISEEIEERTYIPHIRKIDAIDREGDLFRWNVQSDAGKRIFYTNRNAIPRELPSGGIIMKDISGDRYLIPDVGSLDYRSRNWLWLYLD